MKKKTISEIISYTLEVNKRPMKAEEIFEYINSNNLYSFKSSNPLHVLRSTLNKNAINSSSKLKSKNQIFRILDDLKYTLV